MTFEPAGAVSINRLVNEAIGWMNAAVKRKAQSADARTTERRPKERGRRRAKGGSTEPAPPKCRVESDAVIQKMQGYLKAACALEADSLEDLIVEVCRQNSEEPHAPLAIAWTKDAQELQEVDVVGLIADNLISVAIAAAVAAAVVALVLWARRHGTARVQERDLPVSGDLSVLQKLRDEKGVAARLAGEIVEKVSDPWSFDLGSALDRLEPTDKRLLLGALVPHCELVEVIEPSVGDRFEPDTMTARGPLQDGSLWIVAAPSGRQAAGYRFRGRLQVPAEVRACTADWWCLTMADSDCPVAAAVNKDKRLYTGFVDESDTDGWSVRTGFSTRADLREAIGEPELHVWMGKFRNRLENWYGAGSERTPSTFGVVGDRFDRSVMKATDKAGEADARVIAVEDRQGLPQVGFGCAGAPPLLYAIVRIEEE